MVTIRTKEEFIAHIMAAPDHEERPTHADALAKMPMQEIKKRKGNVLVSKEKYPMKITGFYFRVQNTDKAYTELLLEMIREEDLKAYGPLGIRNFYSANSSYHMTNLKNLTANTNLQDPLGDPQNLEGKCVTVQLKKSTYENSQGEEIEKFDVYYIDEWAKPKPRTNSPAFAGTHQRLSDDDVTANDAKTLDDEIPF